MNRNHVFVLACGGLGLIAFSQLLVAGMALAVRFEEGQQVRIVEREVEVEKIVPVRLPFDPGSSVQGAETRLLSAPSETVKPQRVTTPTITNPRAAKLFNEARSAHIAGDMGTAIVKLEEALEHAPDDPQILFEMGEIHETMGVYDRAASYYEKIFQMGVSGAGELYRQAALKLSKGFEQPSDMRGKIALGRVRIFNDAQAELGQRVILDVPVIKAPTEEVESSDIEISVTLFNKTSRGEIVKLQEKSWVRKEWSSLPFEWEDGQETLRVIYQIPDRDEQTRHLFGDLSYYGQVAILSYQGEILDVQAWPRDLAARIGQAAPTSPSGGEFPEFLDLNNLPPDFDPDIPLLNPLPSE